MDIRPEVWIYERDGSQRHVKRDLGPQQDICLEQDANAKEGLHQRRPGEGASFEVYERRIDPSRCSVHC